MNVQPHLSPFPGRPDWRLWTCTCWTEKIGGQPTFPQHIEVAVTIDEPWVGHVVVCRACSSVWFYSSKEIWHKMPVANVPMKGAERLEHYRLGLANDENDLATLPEP